MNYLNKIPILNYSRANFVISSPAEYRREDERQQQTKQRLLDAWDEAQQKGMLNYRMDSCMIRSRSIAGRYGMSIQLNTERGRNRRRPKQFLDICQPFDQETWNFTLLKSEECLFSMVRSEEPDKADAPLIAVNASPISSGHFLAIPSPAKCLNQILTTNAVLCGLELLLLIPDPHFVLCFNGLLAFASVNHLHLQGLFWPYLCGLCREGIKYSSSKSFSIIRRPEWFVPAIVFQLESIDQIKELARRVEKATNFLIGKNVAHNLFIARAPEINYGKLDGQKRRLLPTVYLFPRQRVYEPGDPDCTTFVPAGFELAGLFPVYHAEFFQTVTEERLLQIFDQHAIMTDELFEELVDGLTDCLRE